MYASICYIVCNEMPIHIMISRNNNISYKIKSQLLIIFRLNSINKRNVEVSINELNKTD